jgi:hypothetical protein
VLILTRYEREKKFFFVRISEFMYIKIFHNILLLSCFTLSTRNHFVHISYILKPEGNVACYASTSSFLLSVIRFRSNGRELSSSFHLSPHKRKKNSWVSTLPEPSRRRRHREICALSCFGASSPSEMCLRRRHARVNALAAASCTPRAPLLAFAQAASSPSPSPIIKRDCVQGCTLHAVATSYGTTATSRMTPSSVRGVQAHRLRML